MKVIPLAAFQDNELWLLRDGQRALVVEPGDAGPVAFLRHAGSKLEAILVTPDGPGHHAAAGFTRPERRPASRRRELIDGARRRPQRAGFRFARTA